ncbi:MAG: hypothetical protein WEB87_01635 [Bacteriovoracaceae bacterium]
MICFSVEAKSLKDFLEKKPSELNNIKLQAGSLATLEQYQKKAGNNGEPFTLEFICYQRKDKNLPKSLKGLKCNFSDAKFLEKKVK